MLVLRFPMKSIKPYTLFKQLLKSKSCIEQTVVECIKQFAEEDGAPFTFLAQPPDLSRHAKILLAALEHYYRQIIEHWVILFLQRSFKRITNSPSFNYKVKCFFVLLSKRYAYMQLNCIHTVLRCVSPPPPKRPKGLK